jgi:Ca-activated chloride channel family protein
MNMANPIYNWLFIIPVILFFFYIRVQRQTSQDLERFADKNLISKISDLTGQKLRSRLKVIRMIAIIFILAALIGPEWDYEWQEIRQQGTEIMLAIDTSKSMLATDIKPNRLERVKLAVKDFLGKLNGDKVGLIAFSGTSFLQCPLTLDYNAFSLTLDSLSFETIPRGGTAIGEAIQTAIKAYQGGGSNGTKSLILITDGENHEGDPIPLSTQAAKEGIKVYTIGIGSPDGELIVVPDGKGNSSYLKDDQGHVVKSKLNEEMLRQIAQAGGGSYYHASDISMGLDELYRQKIANINKVEFNSKLQKRYIDRYQFPLFLAILLIAFEIIMEIGSLHPDVLKIFRGNLREVGK